VGQLGPGTPRVEARGLRYGCWWERRLVSGGILCSLPVIGHGACCSEIKVYLGRA